MRNKEALTKRFAEAINCESAENGSDTPDFILGDFLADVLEAWDRAMERREEWHGRPLRSKATAAEVEEEKRLNHLDSDWDRGPKPSGLLPETEDQC